MSFNPSRRSFLFSLAAFGGGALVLAAPASARSWPREDDPHLAYRRFRGEDEVGDGHSGSGHGGGGSSGGGSTDSGGHGGGGSSESGGNSGSGSGDDKKKPNGTPAPKPSIGGDDDDRFGTRK